MDKHLSKIAAGLVSVAIVGLFAWTRSIDIALVEIRAQVRAIAAATEKDLEQDSKIKKFWKLHSWARARINEERVARNTAIAEWPDLGE